MVNILDFGTTKSALLSAIASGAKSIYFPEGTYNYTGNPIVLDRAITLYGDGKESTTILLGEGFRTNTGGLEVRDIAFKAPTYSGSNVAFKNTYTGTSLSASVSGFTFINCIFDGFFYATYLSGAEYEVASNPSFQPAGYVTRVKIQNCESFAPPLTKPGSNPPANQNSGHFQHILCRDVLVEGCSTYGGGSNNPMYGASSYNFIGNNGYLRVIGNYDAFNTYASIEIENQSGPATVVGNTVGSDIWIDDSSNVEVHANNVERDIIVSVQHFDVRNVTVLGNHASRIRLIKIGATQTNPLIVDAIQIARNNLNGTGTFAIFVQDADNRIKRLDIDGNFITGNYTSGSIGIYRYGNLYAQVRNNWLINTGVIGVTLYGSAGTVTQTGNV